MIKAVFFDAANTLVHKPHLFDTICRVLQEEGIVVDKQHLIHRHKILSEIIDFPDRTNREFYLKFNQMLLSQLGILPNIQLADKLYRACSSLPWSSFEDVSAVGCINLPMGVISNWDNSLLNIMAENVPITFRWVFGSEDSRLRKPDPSFFRLIADKTGINPNHILVVGDSIRLDVAPALESGMKALLIDRLDFYPKNYNVIKIKSFWELKAEINKFL